MGNYAPALADLEAALKLKPDDFDTTQKLGVVRAKLATPKPVVQGPAPSPTVAPPAEPMDMRMKIGIGAGALVVLIIIIIIISRRKSRGY